MKARNLSAIMGVLFMAAAACSGTASANRGTVFLCDSDGIKPGLVSVSNENICNQFKAEIQNVLSIKLQNSSSPDLQNTDWIKVEVAYQKPGIIKATISRSIDGQQNTWPSTFLAVSDAEIGQRQIATLVRSASADIIPKE